MGKMTEQLELHRYMSPVDVSKSVKSHVDRFTPLAERESANVWSS